MVVLLAGLSASLWQMDRADRERDAKADALEAAQQAKAAAEQAAAMEKAANEQAQKRLTQIEKGNELILSIFEDLDIRKIRARSDRWRRCWPSGWSSAAEQLEGEAVGDPLVVAGYARPPGRIAASAWATRARRSAAREVPCHPAAKLGADHPDTLTSMNNLATGYQAAGKLDLALPLFEETLKLRKAKLGPDHPDTLTSMNNLAVGLPGRREAGPGPAALRGDAEARRRPSWAPTTPTRSPA